jgi:hypothetical protein
MPWYQLFVSATRLYGRLYERFPVGKCRSLNFYGEEQRSDAVLKLS